MQSPANLWGLLSDVERKNSWQLAEWLTENSPDDIQYLLERADWDADATSLLDSTTNKIDQKRAFNNPQACKRWIHCASFTSVFRPGTERISRAFERTTSNPYASRIS